MPNTKAVDSLRLGNIHGYAVVSVSTQQALTRIPAQGGQDLYLALLAKCSKLLTVKTSDARILRVRKEIGDDEDPQGTTSYDI